MKKICLALLTILLFSSTAHARVWTVNIGLVSGPNSVSRQEAKRMFIATQSTYAAVNINLKLGYIHGAKGKNPKANLYNWETQFWYWQKKIGKIPRNQHQIIYTILPPILFQGEVWLAGMAAGICNIYTESPFAVGYAKVQKNNRSMFWQSVLVMKHELGHLFGASHDLGKDIMNAHAIDLKNIMTLQFSQESISQMNKCLSFDIY